MGVGAGLYMYVVLAPRKSFDILALYKSDYYYYYYVVVVQKFTFAISSPDEFLSLSLIVSEL